jgi:hypothetical protein
MNALQGTLFDEAIYTPRKIKNIELFHPWDSINEFINILSRRYATVILFHSKLKVGDVVTFDTTSYSTSYSSKKFHKKQGIIKSLSETGHCADIAFEGQENLTWMNTEKIVTVNGIDFSPDHCYKDLEEMIKQENSLR